MIKEAGLRAENAGDLPSTQTCRMKRVSSLKPGNWYIQEPEK